jgi:hypothetical protein
MTGRGGRSAGRRFGAGRFRAAVVVFFFVATVLLALGRGRL